MHTHTTDDRCAGKLSLLLLLLLLTAPLIWAADAETTPAPEGPGIGALLARTPDGVVMLPVLKLEVRLDVAGVMVHGTVEEEFSNSTDQVLEALYVLPLPDRAAVDSMEMLIGGRRIVAVVQEREEAQASFDRAREAGRKAALLAQTRPNLFTTAVTNINPGEQVSVHVTFVEELSVRGVEFEVSFPLTYTPRYAPAQRALSEDAQLMNSGFVRESGADAPRVTIVATIDEGLPLAGLESPSHTIVAETTAK